MNLQEVMNNDSWLIHFIPFVYFTGFIFSTCCMLLITVFIFLAESLIYHYFYNLSNFLTCLTSVYN